MGGTVATAGKIESPGLRVDHEGRCMKTAFIAGIVLILLGALGLAYGGIHYTKHERVFDAGPIHATRDEPQTVTIPPVLSGIVLVGGIVLLVVGAKRS